MKKKRIPGAQGGTGVMGWIRMEGKGQRRKGKRGRSCRERPKGAKAKSGTMSPFKICEPIGCVRA